MRTLIVTDHKQKWFEIADTAVLTARRYLEEPDSGGEGSVRVLNLCRIGRYQGRGYYVSLLAEDRGQRPPPDVKTVEDPKSQAHVQTLSAQLEPLVHETLHHDESDRFELDVHFGNHPAQRHQALAEQLFGKMRAPLLRALFIVRKRCNGWYGRRPWWDCRPSSSVPRHYSAFEEGSEMILLHGSRFRRRPWRVVEFVVVRIRAACERSAPLSFRHFHCHGYSLRFTLRLLGSSVAEQRKQHLAQ